MSRAAGRLVESIPPEPPVPRERILQSVLTCMADGVVLADPRGRLLLLNREAERLFGIGPSDTIPEYWSESFGLHLADGVTPYPWAQLPLARAARGEPVGPEDVFVRHERLPEGRWLSVTARPIRAAEGSPGGAVAVFRDITERRRAEERLQALSHRLVAAHESERRRLARELHDEIGQLLTGLNLTLERGLRAPRREAGVLSGARDLVRQLMRRVREISFELRPAMLDDLGLAPALAGNFERYTAQTGVRVRFRHRGIARRFGSEVEVAAYRIVQESLTNVARHARVEEVSVRLSVSRGRLIVEVADAGAGFAAGPSARAGGAGLSGMHERATALGGSLEVESAPGRGTRLRAELPLPRRTA